MTLSNQNRGIIYIVDLLQIVRVRVCKFISKDMSIFCRYTHHFREKVVLFYCVLS